MDLEETIKAQHEAMREIVNGNPEPTKALYSSSDDVTLANPWGPAIKGRAAVDKMLDFVGTRFRDGILEDVERLAAYVDENVATVLENETYRVKVGGRDELSPFKLRVSCTYRREGGEWKLVLRHADPITEPRDDLPTS